MNRRTSTAAAWDGASRPSPGANLLNPTYPWAEPRAPLSRALLRFLQAIGSRWNISLFHYRNHGSDYGKVLAGVQVAPADADEFALHLRELSYAYTEETSNPSYRMFLGHG